ncbi:cytochrome P450 CYP12A2-like [Uranotaenia lowii]|uniref:cytochrome P450 CYP12A2-like n=1 Tax=Uranotaenia lowii TaxID=190385 RepID=UPI0024783329|nr:cytochrome P450 CYP12A2-like [Uranotaenia lowii]XP_055595529.1 cytochrome P450 CYP12A2-like [Uranotaenia lowii]
MLRILKRSSGCAASSFRFYSAQSAASTAVDPEWANALPFEKIPGPPKAALMAGMIYGGLFTQEGTLVDQLQTIRKTYGDLVRVPGVFGRPTRLLSFSPDDCERVFRTEGQWPMRASLETFTYYRKELRKDVFKDMGLVTEHGEDWHKFRTIVNPVLMQPKTVNLYVDKLDEVAREFIGIMGSLRDEKSELPGNFNQWINRLAMEMMGVLALDTRLGVLSADKAGEAEKLVGLVRDLFQLSFELDVQPSIWKYVKTPTFHRLMAVFDEITQIISAKIDESIIRYEKNPSVHSDTMSVLEKLLKIDRQVAFVMVFDMMQAGIDTTSAATTGILFSLATNLDKQNKLREELRTIMPTKDSPLTTENMRNLPYLRACIKESLRLVPAIVGNARNTGQDLVLQGYQVHKGTELMISSVVLNQDDRHFERAKEYIPERWLRGNESPNVKDVHPFQFLPFGFGPRACVGRRLAMMEMEIFIARVTRQFEYRWNHGPLRIRNSIVNTVENELRFEMKDVED